MSRGRSRLVPLGFALMIAGIAFPRALQAVVAGLEPGTLRQVATAASMILYGGFLTGLVLAVAGILRNRRALRR